MRKSLSLFITAVMTFMVGGIVEHTYAEDPTIVGSVDTPGNAYGVYVTDSYAYVADHNGGLQVIDITAPSTPTIVGSLDVIYAHKVHVTGGYAYVAGGLILYVIDISDPQNPVLEGHTTAFARNARDLHVSGGYAYGVYDGLWSGVPFGYLKVIDVSDPQNPSVAATVSMGKGAAGVHVTGGYAYVTDGGWEGLHVIDVSDPKNPAIVGSVNKPQGAEDVYMSNGYAYVAAWDNDLQVFNVSNPGSPIFVSSVDTPGQATGVYVSGSYAYVADKSGLQVIVNVTWENEPPTADAGPDQTVDEGVIVTLDGSNSTDPDDGIASYQWTQTAGTSVTLSDATAVQPTFTSPNGDEDGESLTFQLTVTDNSALQSTDTCIVNVTWQNIPPTANAGPDQTVDEGETVTLDGSNSTDPDGTISSYLWSQTGGTPVTLSDSTSSMPTFTAPTVGVSGEALTFQLTVTDNGGLQAADSCTVTISPSDVYNRSNPMVAYNNGLAVDFGTSDLYHYNGTSWSQISTNNPEWLTAYNGSLVGDFGTYGLWQRMFQSKIPYISNHYI